jgi:hypothetical protein
MPEILATQEAEISSKPAPANNSRDPILKKNHHKKRAGGVAQGEGTEFKPQDRIKKKKKRKNLYLFKQTQVFFPKTGGC